MEIDKTVEIEYKMKTRTKGKRQPPAATMIRQRQRDVNK